MRILFAILLTALVGCSQQPSAPTHNWYSLSPNERLITELTLAPEQTTNIVIQSTNKMFLGFKSDVPVSYAAQNRDLNITLRSTNTFGWVSSGMGAGTGFHGSEEGIHLEVSSDFSFPVRVVIYQAITK